MGNGNGNDTDSIHAGGDADLAGEHQMLPAVHRAGKTELLREVLLKKMRAQRRSLII